MEGDADSLVDRCLDGHNLLVLKHLLTKGVIPSGKSLLRTIHKNDLEALCCLLDAGVDIHYMRDEPLAVVSKMGRWEAMSILLERGAAINSRDGAPFVLACGYGRLECVRLLTYAGADIHSHSDSGFLYACNCGHLDCVQFLVDFDDNLLQKFGDSIPPPSKETEEVSKWWKKKFQHN